jgi:hypothetical protein
MGRTATAFAKYTTCSYEKQVVSCEDARNFPNDANVNSNMEVDALRVRWVRPFGKLRAGRLTHRSAVSVVRQAHQPLVEVHQPLVGELVEPVEATASC